MSEILILDIETTGFQNQGGKIVEIGIVSLNLETGNKRLLFDQMVYEKGITQEECENSWVVANTTITVDDIKFGLRLDKIHNVVQNIINAYPYGITAYNISFDVNFMESRGFKFPKLLPCPMKVATPILKLPKSLKAKKAGFGKGYKYPSAQEAYDYFFPNSGYVKTHRGADDAFHEAEIVYELYKLGVFKID